jgi:hypothetical protein
MSVSLRITIFVNNKKRGDLKILTVKINVIITF